MLLTGWQIAGLIVGCMMAGGAFGVVVMGLVVASRGWQRDEEDDEDD